MVILAVILSVIGLGVAIACYIYIILNMRADSHTDYLQRKIIKLENKIKYLENKLKRWL